MSATILEIASQYSKYTGWIIIGIGMLGNILNLLIFTHFKFFRNNQCIFYVIIETISNIINELFLMTVTILSALYGTSAVRNSIVTCKLNYIIPQTCALVTAYMICCAAIDQFFTTNYRVYLRQICTLKLARYMVIIIVIIWLAHSILFSFFVNINSSIGCTITNSIWIQYVTYFFFPIAGGLLPILIASIFSLLAFRNVRRIIRRQIPIQRRRLDRQITAMILLRAVVYVFLTLPYVAYRIYIINVSITPSDPSLYAIIQLVQVILTSLSNLNFAITFYIFIVSSSRYRHQVKHALIKYWQQCKSICCIKDNQVEPTNAASINSNNDLE